MKLPFQPFDKDADFAQTRRRLPHRTQPGCTYFVTWRLADSVPREVLERWKQERGEFYRVHPKPWDTRTQRSYDERFPRRMERWADAGHGACHLRESHLRQIMVDAFHHFDGQRYDLDSYVVMPNHVHVLVTPRHECVAELQPASPDVAELQPASPCVAELQPASPCVAELQPASPDVQGPRGEPPPDEGQTKTPPHTDTDEQTEALQHTGRPWSLSWMMKQWKGASSFRINKALGRRGTLWMDESFDHAVRSELQLERFRRYIRENPAKAGLKEGEFTLWESQSVAELQSASRGLAEDRCAASQQSASRGVAEDRCAASQQSASQCVAELQSASRGVAELQSASRGVAEDRCAASQQSAPSKTLTGRLKPRLTLDENTIPGSQREARHLSSLISA